jgi:penicillin V acylase-like amidase (Ntn superfamily)
VRGWRWDRSGDPRIAEPTSSASASTSPGTNRVADRFARASFLLGAIPKKIDPRYIKGVPRHPD